MVELNEHMDNCYGHFLFLISHQPSIASSNIIKKVIGNTPGQKLVKFSSMECRCNTSGFKNIQWLIYVLWESHVPIPTFQSSEMGYIFGYGGSM
jgi:hypothetical protein